MNEASKARLRLWIRLLGLTRRIEGDLREKLRNEFATTLPRFDVMAALYRFPEGLKMSELSSVLHVSNGNVTGIVNRLVADGLVAREVVENDRRTFRVSLLPDGADEFERQAEAHERWINGHLAMVEHDRADRLVALMNAMAAQDTDEAINDAIDNEMIAEVIDAQ